MPLSTKIDLIDSPFSPSVPIIENTDDVKNIIKNQEINFSAPSIESLIPSTLGIIPSQVLVSEIPKYLLESSYVDVQPLPDLCVADSE